MCVQRGPVVEPHEEMFAVCVSTGEHSACEVGGRQSRVAHHGSFDDGTGEPLVEPVGEAAERVTLGHPRIVRAHPRPVPSLP